MFTSFKPYGIFKSKLVVFVKQYPNWISANWRVFASDRPFI